MPERLTTDGLRDLVMNYATSCGVMPSVALAQLARESANFRQDVVYGPFVGGDGEKGLAQFIPDTWARFGSGPHDNAYEPGASLAAYCRYMQYLLGLFGDYEKALQGYNGGEGNVQRGTVSTRAQNYAREVLAQAAAMGEIGPIVVTPSGYKQSQFPMWLMIGLVGVLLWAAMSD